MGIVVPGAVGCEQCSVCLTPKPLPLSPTSHSLLTGWGKVRPGPAVSKNHEAQEIAYGATITDVFAK